MKILHTADIHLREDKNDRWVALEKLIEIGKNEKIDIFVISGDLFDKGIDAEKMKVKIRRLFSNNGFDIIIIPGNHDYKSYKKRLDFGEDVRIITSLEEPVEYEDVIIWGFPFASIEKEDVAFKLHSIKKRLDTNKKNILLYHGEILDAFPYSEKDFGEEGAKRYMPAKLSYFEDLRFDYVLAGHFHFRFAVWEIGENQYFVYPGSPISITKREIGQRKVNLFEVGKPPKEYYLETPYYEEIKVKLNPLKDENPVEIVKRQIEDTPSYAKIILKIIGYFNAERIRMNEVELSQRIKDIAKDRCNITEDLYLEHSDIHKILEDDLFKSFERKLKQMGFDKEKEKQIYDFTIRAMLEVNG